MLKPDELAFRKAVLDRGAAFKPTAGKISQELGIHPKRAHAICEKWTDKGWWEYGVSPLCGWLTDAGREEFSK